MQLYPTDKCFIGVTNPEDEEKVQQMRMRSAEREVIKEKESQKTKENKKQRSLAEF